MANSEIKLNELAVYFDQIMKDVARISDSFKVDDTLYWDLSSKCAFDMKTEIGEGAEFLVGNLRDDVEFLRSSEENYAASLPHLIGILKYISHMIDVEYGYKYKNQKSKGAE